MQDYDSDMKNEVYYDYVLENKFGEFDKTKNDFIGILKSEKIEF